MYKLLSNISLSSWDEAWYGVIANNIAKSGDIFNLLYNGKPFYDHPPFVFWLQAIAIKIFGLGEFAVRFPSFILGIATIFIVFLLGKKMFGISAGFFSGLALVTSPWFLTRSLSGNLDVPLTFLFVLTLYLGCLTAENKKFAVALSISLACLFLTKTLVPFTIIPVLIFILWRKISIKELLVPSLIFLCLVLPWFVVNFVQNPELLNRYLTIGYPGDKSVSGIVENIMLTKKYIHNGMGNWFYFGFFSIVFGTLFFRKIYLPIVIFITIFLIPFMFSNKGHIWHLIPLHPFWILSFFGLIELLLNKFKRVKNLKFIVMIIAFYLISWNQLKRNWYETIMAYSYKSDIEILATKSKEYDYPLILDDDAVPEALFYSEKDRIVTTYRDGGLKEIFGTDDKFLLITRDWRLVEEKISDKAYKFIAKDRDKVLILKDK